MTDDNPALRVKSGDDLMREMLDEDSKMRDLPASHPDHPLGFDYDPDSGVWGVYWGGYDYWIEDDRLKTSDDLVDWIHQFGEKTWKGMTVYKIRKFIEAVRLHWGEPIRR